MKFAEGLTPRGRAQGFISLGKVLEKTINSLGIKKRLGEARAISAWEKAVGPQIASQTQPLKIQDGKLIVKVESSTWKNELVFLKQELIGKLNQSVGEEVVADIIFVN